MFDILSTHFSHLESFSVRFLALCVSLFLSPQGAMRLAHAQAQAKHLIEPYMFHLLSDTFVLKGVMFSLPIVS